MVDLAAIDDVGVLAQVLRQLRRREGRRRGGEELTYRQLADRTGWSISTISSYLGGKVLPPTGRFDELARVLGASPAELGALATARDRVDEARRAAPVARCQLPPDPPRFTGRAADLARLDDALGAAPVIVVSGTAGAGKSALAARWAHTVRDRFPDGQLHLDLRGYSPAPPLQPADVLAQALRALGVAADRVPTDTDEAAALYRGLVAGRRLLLLLDDARTAGQVRAVLPGTPGSLVLVTSRDQLPGLVALDGAQHLVLGLLGADDALDLLAVTAGRERVEADPAAAAELAAACAHLPLALRIAAATLATRPQLSLRAYLRRLRHDRLSALEVGGDSHAAVRGAFDLSYRSVPAPARRLLRLLGSVPGPDIAEDAAVALLGGDAGAAVEAVDQLCAAHLLSQPAPDRFALHELLRCYAAERAEVEDTADDRAAGLDRLYAWYEEGARSAAEAVHPERLRLPRATPATSWPPARALAWFTAEQANLLAVVGCAGAGPAGWRILDSTRAYCAQAVPTADWRAAADAALAAAEAAADLPGQASAHLNLAEIARRTGDYVPAIEHYERCVALSERAGWPEGAAAALGNLGTICRYAGRTVEAVAHFTRSAELNRAAGRDSGLAASLGGLGIVHREQGDLAAAEDRLRAALALYRAAGSTAGTGAALDNLGETLLAAGRHDEAMTCFREALTLHRSLGSAPNEAIALGGLAAVHSAQGRGGTALELAEQALVTGWETADWRLRIELLFVLAGVHTGLGRVTDATARYGEALDLARSSGNAYPEAVALVGLAGLAPDPAPLARPALAIATRCGFQLLRRQAEQMLAT
jgi:tetratricopeptide (TPR) repeat protein